MRKLLYLAMTVILLIPAVVMAQGGDPALSGVEWLNTQQEENGSFGDEVGATSLAIFASVAVNEENTAALDWLAEQDYTEIGLDEVGLALIALNALGEDISAFADGELLARFSALLRDFETQNTDALCIGLIARYNLDLPLSEELVSALVSRQLESGGFAVNAETETADVTTTSLCIHVLSAAEQADALVQGLEYLRSVQLEDDGWSIDSSATEGDPLGTAFAIHALTAAGEVLTDWGSPERTLIAFANEDGAFINGDGSNDFLNVISTIVAIPVFRGVHLNSFAPAAQAVATEPDTGGGAAPPVLDANWGLIGDGFMIELDTADDFFTTVVDPFTGDELYGVEIINWTAEYTYTGYIVENYLTADILLWMIDQDPSVADDVSTETLSLMATEELQLLPEDLQARANQ